jgi:predicted Zn-dependent protease
MNKPVTADKKKRQLKLHQRIAATYAKLSLWNKLAVLALVLALPLGYGALLLLKPVYKSWRADNALKIASKAVESGDMKAASLAFRTAIRSRPKDPDVWRRVGEFLDQAESPESVIIWERVLRLDASDLEARFALVNSALRSQRIEKARLALTEIPETERTSERYHRAAAAVALAAGDVTAATEHLDAILAVNPEDEEARWDLTRVGVVNADPATRTAARERMNGYADGGTERAPEALRQLTRLALAESDFYTANQLAGRLVTLPEATAQDQVLFLDTEFASQSFTLPGSITKILDYAEADPTATTSVVPYLAARGMGDRLEQWLADLPPDVRSQRPVQSAWFDLALRSGDWTQAFAILRSEDSPYSLSSELVDLSEKSLADYRRGSQDALPAWQKAIFLAESDPQATFVLVTMAGALDWRQANNLALWNLAASVGDRPEIWMELLKSELANQNSAGILRALSGAIRADPDNRQIRNDWILMNILLDQGRPEDLIDLAKGNADFDPANSFYATTYALILAETNQLDRAVEIVNAIPESERKEPAKALYVGTVLALAGQHGEADNYLKIATTAQDKFLPEEAALFRNAKQIASGQLTRGQQLELLTAGPAMTDEERVEFTSTLRSQMTERGDQADSEAVIQNLRDDAESGRRSPEEMQRILDGLRQIGASQPPADAPQP